MRAQVALSANNLLVASSWDNHMRAWSVQKSGQQMMATFAGQATHDGPVLCCCFNGDGSAAFSGGADNTVRMWQFGDAAGAKVIGRHDQPVKSVHWVPQLNMVATGSWDATVRFWDLRSPTEALKIPFNQKVYAMDVNFPFMAVSTAETGPTATGQCPLVHLYNIQGQSPMLFQNAPIVSSLKHQTRCISVFNNQRQGFAVSWIARKYVSPALSTRKCYFFFFRCCGAQVGSVEGRVEIKDINEMAGKRSFAFKCHRIKDPAKGPGNKEINHVYPVNSIAFNARGTFATAGADGSFNFWDKENKTRIKEFKPGMGCRVAQATQPANAPPHPITSCAFSPDCSIFAYACSYDWSRGDDPNMAARPNDIYLHAVSEAELKPQPKGR